MASKNIIFKIYKNYNFDEENFMFRRRKPSDGSDGVETYVEQLESMDF